LLLGRREGRLEGRVSMRRLFGEQAQGVQGWERGGQREIKLTAREVAWKRGGGGEGAGEGR
jgi:hypothetical protein